MTNAKTLTANIMKRNMVNAEMMIITKLQKGNLNSKMQPFSSVTNLCFIEYFLQNPSNHLYFMP